jgi:glucoamylase
MKYIIPSFLLLSILTLISCQPEESEVSLAPGGPGDESFWNYAGKTGVGTAYEMYSQNGYQDGGPSGTISKVWFSLTKGILTETAYGMIHEAQLKDLQLVVKGADFVDLESEDTKHSISYLHQDDAGRPLSLAYRLINQDKDGKYTIEKHVFTDPDRQALFYRIIFTPHEEDLELYVMANPHIANTGVLDSAFVDEAGLHAAEGDSYMSLISSTPFETQNAGFKGSQDLLTSLRDNTAVPTFSATDGKGNVVLSGGWKISGDTFTTDLVIGFGESLTQSKEEAAGALSDGYENRLKAYNGEGAAIGWEDYLSSLENLPDMIPATGDNGKLLHTSALVLKALEDKENAGALIASLSIPWGDSVSAESSATGYRAVWPRDFYQCAMALLALGDEKTPKTAFEYLKKVQVTEETPGNAGAGGWFLQKTVVDGTLEWFRVQMDQTAMPIMLGWKLWDKKVISDDSIAYWYTTMLQPAAEFLTTGGQVSLSDNKAEIIPPFTQQERWEEQYGYSPSTMAAIISGLVCAGDIARSLGREEEAQRYLEAADSYEKNLETYTYTTEGEFGDGEYYIRISRNIDPNDKELLGDNNARPGMPEDQILDAGFLELVRYGVRSADDPRIRKSITVLDDTSRDDNLQVRYLFGSGGVTYEGWRRYGNDGYGEDVTDGSNYGRFGPGQRGRVWPFFTGERGHYMVKFYGQDELTNSEKQELTNRYAGALEFFANEGLMLPEQVWDNVGENEAHEYQPGEGTSSATPLAWTHAEYVKLVKSIASGEVWDSYPIVEARYLNN